MLGNRDEMGKPEAWWEGSSDCMGGRAVRVASVDMACLYALDAASLELGRCHAYSREERTFRGRVDGLYGFSGFGGRVLAKTSCLAMSSANS